MICINYYETLFDIIKLLTYITFKFINYLFYFLKMYNTPIEITIITI